MKEQIYNDGSINFKQGYQCPYCKKELSYYSPAESRDRQVVNVKHCRKDIFLLLEKGEIIKVMK